MRLKAERFKLHNDSLERKSLEPSELMMALLWESDGIFEIQSSLKK